MAYDFEITSGRHGDPISSDGLEVCLDYRLHEQLFKSLDRISPGFPHLNRFRDHYTDGFVGHESLKELITEVERASSYFDFDSPFKPFFGSFHSLCCIAWSRDGSISAYAD